MKQRVGISRPYGSDYTVEGTLSAMRTPLTAAEVHAEVHRRLPPSAFLGGTEPMRLAHLLREKGSIHFRWLPMRRPECSPMPWKPRMRKPKALHEPGRRSGPDELLEFCQARTKEERRDAGIISLNPLELDYDPTIGASRAKQHELDERYR